jgi:hypothetical protein
MHRKVTPLDTSPRAEGSYGLVESSRRLSASSNASSGFSPLPRRAVFSSNTVSSPHGSLLSDQLSMEDINDSNTQDVWGPQLLKPSKPGAAASLPVAAMLLSTVQAATERSPRTPTFMASFHLLFILLVSIRVFVFPTIGTNALVAGRRTRTNSSGSEALSPLSHTALAVTRTYSQPIVQQVCAPLLG